MTLSLRSRLVLAFVLVGALTAIAVAGLLYVQSRTLVLQKSQDATVTAWTQLISRTPVATTTPTQADLDELVDRLSEADGEVVVVHNDLHSPNSAALEAITPQLRQAVANGQVAWQRVAVPSSTILVVGTAIAGTGGTEAYLLRSLHTEAESIAGLADLAWFAGGVSLVFAILLALLAARSVLRPVGALDRAARRLGEGDLTTRVQVTGADELAGVATTFNTTAQALEDQVGELRRMEADARRFVADVSHELRTPLAAMTAVADVLTEDADQLPDDTGRAARLIAHEVHNLTRLVNDLIEVTRFDSGTAALMIEHVDVTDVIRATLRSRGWTDLVHTEMPESAIAGVDPRRLDVIVANLVGNALRHGAPPVTLTLTVDAPSGTGPADQPEVAWLQLTVTDHGPGLAPDVLPHVFDRFYKASTARGRSEGSGLGLAIAWENARLHHGTLTATTHHDTPTTHHDTPTTHDATPTGTTDHGTLIATTRDDTSIATHDATLTTSEGSAIITTHENPLTTTHEGPLTTTHDNTLTTNHDGPLSTTHATTTTHDATLTTTHDGPLTTTHAGPLTTHDATHTTTHDGPLTTTHAGPLTTTHDATLTPSPGGAQFTLRLPHHERPS